MCVSYHLKMGGISFYAVLQVVVPAELLDLVVMNAVVVSEMVTNAGVEKVAEEKAGQETETNDWLRVQPCLHRNGSTVCGM